LAACTFGGALADGELEVGAAGRGVVVVRDSLLDASADLRSSWLALRWDSPTAPRAFSIACVSPATPGAEPWYGVVAADRGAGVCGAVTDWPPPLEPEWPRSATNHSAARTATAPIAI
jgi:hypothetical protein